jgi:hypothetical protein
MAATSSAPGGTTRSTRPWITPITFRFPRRRARLEPPGGADPRAGGPRYPCTSPSGAIRGHAEHGGDTAVQIAPTTATSTALFHAPVRFPFKKWQWFTVNTTASWRTYYWRSLSAGSGATHISQTVTDNPLNRAFYTLTAQLVGPVFNKIWDTPNNGARREVQAHRRTVSQYQPHVVHR